MYSKIAGEEDSKIVENCSKEADGILIFVSRHISPYMKLRTSTGNIERFILCHCRCFAYDLNPRPQAKLTRHLRILPKEHLSASSSRQPKCFSSVDPVCFGRTSSILSTKICHLGELTLVPELGYQPFVCHGGNYGSELGSSILLGLSAATLYVREASANPCNLC
jgi:hypothetical protein